MSFFNNLLNGIKDSWDPIGLFHTGSSGPTGQSTSLFDLWDKIKNGNSNDVNYEIAQDNLDYQRERNEIEDARYEDETAYNRAFAEEERNYNRAWAEEEREYNRALQQQLFEREDTAMSRQAADLASIGINPLSMNLSGAGAGQAVSPATAPSGSAPSGSSRGGQALQNQFQMLPNGILDVLKPVMSLADTMNGVQTGKYQRDALALQNDKQFLDNLKTANSLGIKYNGLFEPSSTGWNKFRKDGYVWNFVDEKGKNLFDTDDFKKGLYSDYNKRYFENTPDWAKTLDAINNDSVYQSAEKALTNASKLFDKASSNLFNNSIFDLGEMNGKFNPITFIMKLFGLGI